MVELTRELREEYLTLYTTSKIRPERLASVKRYIDKAQRYQARYEAVSKETGVPWFVIFVIHSMESSCDWSCHLHNGDPLIDYTHNVPAGRPKTHKPPFTWEESAIDALGYDGAASWKDWSLSGILYFCERYNGWGYRTGAGQRTTPPHRSAYLWSFTTAYEKGRYVSDKKFDPESVSDQAGVVSLIKGLEDRGMIRLILPENPIRDADWLEIYRLDQNGMVQTGLAANFGNTTLETMTATNTQSVIDFLEKHKVTAHTTLVAPPGQALPRG